MNTIRRTLMQILRFSVNTQSAAILSTQILIGIGLSILTLFFAVKITEDILTHEVIRFDAPILAWMYSARTPILTYFMLACTHMGNAGILILAIGATIVLTYKRHRRDAVLFLAILLVGVGLTVALKSTVGRPRPSLDPLVMESSFSFPSGHAMNSTIFYASLSYFVFRRLRRVRLRQFLLVVSMLVIGLVGISRVYLGAHYPSDVLAGHAIGLLWFVLVLVFSRILRFFHLFRSYRRAQRSLRHVR